MKILLSGSAAFIGGYLVQELLDHGNRMIGNDNFKNNEVQEHCIR